MGTLTAMAAGAKRRNAPRHFWLVAALAALWNFFGLYDMAVMFLAGPAYLDRLSDYRRAWVDVFHALPPWLQALSAAAAAAGAAGALLMLLRRALAAWAFIVPLAAGLVWIAYAGAAMQDTINAVGVVSIGLGLVVTGFEIWYCRAMTRRGVLR